MDSILELLYDVPASWSGDPQGPDSEFVKTARIKYGHLDKLMDGLTESQKELFEAYCDADTKIEGMIHSSQFSYAFHLGAQMMLELIQGREKLMQAE